MLTDLKMKRCRGCDKLMIDVVKEYHFTYCEECFAKYQRPEYKKDWYDH